MFCFFGASPMGYGTAGARTTAHHKKRTTNWLNGAIEVTLGYQGQGGSERLHFVGQLFEFVCVLAIFSYVDVNYRQ